ncbi:hypothetical protein LX32DRAFT_635993 [Colletotrichum zoysiae]|uniref:Secreted protein n=1 Tax=Colletotrichum zoysiae TaxID=1216348 RepID=A0AAD9M8H7_9PEZI|nr:hypothetical protein LX32DRAFT_635993 [Colletotrichum zoysiae]
MVPPRPTSFFLHLLSLHLFLFYIEQERCLTDPKSSSRVHLPCAVNNQMLLSGQLAAARPHAVAQSTPVPNMAAVSELQLAAQ